MEERSKLARHVGHLNIKELIQREQIHPKLSSAIIEMVVSRSLPYYGEFTQFINFFKAKIPTCGVNVTDKGMCFYWGQEWVDKLTSGQAVFTTIHEVMHLLFDHIKRGVGYDRKLSNLAMDMIINSLIHGDLMIEEDLSYMMEIPKDEDGKNSLIFLPKEYDGLPIFEILYAWLSEKQSEWRKKNKDKIEEYKKIKVTIDEDGNGHIDRKSRFSDQDDYGSHGKSGDKGQNEVDMYPLDRWFESVEFGDGMEFDFHFDDDVSDEVRKQWSQYVVDKLRARGLETSDMERMLGKLRQSEKNYMKEIKRYMSNDVFGNIKNKSIVKPNRRDIPGLKGHRKYKNMVNCILDVSGSMEGSFEQALSYVFQNEIFLNLIQCDTEVKKTVMIKNKHELEKMRIQGLGGTELTPALQFIANDKTLNKYGTIVLSDGYCDTLNFSGLKNSVLIISTGQECPTVPGSNSHGIRIKQVIVEKKAT